MVTMEQKERKRVLHVLSVSQLTKAILTLMYGCREILVCLLALLSVLFQIHVAHSSGRSRRDVLASAS